MASAQMKVGAMLGGVIALATVVGAFKALGYSEVVEILPASRAHVHRIAAQLFEQQAQDGAFWIEQFQAEQRRIEFEKEQFRLQYPEKPVPRVFDDQHQTLQNRIKCLENMRMLQEPTQ